MEFSVNIDVFFNTQVTSDMLKNLKNWVGFPVGFDDWRIVEFENGDCSYFVTINTQAESPDKIIYALWDNLKIPFIAYEDSEKNYRSCVKWVADRDGIRNVTIVVEDDKY